MRAFQTPFSLFSKADNSRMRTRRPLSINNSLCHGICNYNCKMCGVNKSSYSGPKAFQPREVTEELIQRITEAARSGIRIRIVANSGDGEPTLHPEFCERMNMFGDMVRSWDADVPVPEISIVTNGANLLRPDVISAVTENPITVNISLPTTSPLSYGDIMMCDASKGSGLLKKVIPGIEKMMNLKARGELRQLYFHISPPVREVVRRDFDQTVSFLTQTARSQGLDCVNLVMFPATSNRTGLIRNTITSMDSYRDLFARYHNKTVNGVRVNMTTVMKRFFHRFGEILDMLRAYDYPCIWNGNFFITAEGDSICCNDQAVRNPFGNIHSKSLEELMEVKEQYTPNGVCRGCDQQPGRMKGSVIANLLNYGGRLRMRMAGIRKPFEPVHPRLVPSADKRTLPSADRTRLTHRLNVIAMEPAAVENEADEDCMSIGIASSVDDLRASYALTYKQYRSYGYIDENPFQTRVMFWNALPEAYTVVAKKNGRVIGTLTCVMDSENGLPMDDVAQDQLNELRRNKRRLCEVSGLAIDRERADNNTILHMIQFIPNQIRFANWIYSYT